MSKEKFEMIAKTFQGLEEVLAKELINLGADDVEILRRGVSFKGDLKMLYKANLCCRTALRILKPIFHFQAEDADDVYDKVKQLDWSQYLDPSKTFAVDAVVYSEIFKHSKFLSYKVKDAIADHFREKCDKRPSVRIDNPDIQVSIHVAHDQCTISLDSSGESLHKRGYRVGQTEAPINEVLAAGLLLIAGWDGQSDLIDPMCGSGTILIEAAMIALNIPPGIYRPGFAFEKWPDFDQELFDELYNDESQEREFEHKIYGSDILRKAIAISEENVKSAGVSKYVHLKVCPIQELKVQSDNAFVIFNPPYGERIGSKDLGELYSEIGSKLKHDFTGKTVWVITVPNETTQKIGLAPSERYELLNGGIECEFRKYEMFAGRRNDFVRERKELGFDEQEGEERPFAKGDRKDRARFFREREENGEGFGRRRLGDDRGFNDRERREGGFGRRGDGYDRYSRRDNDGFSDRRRRFDDGDGGEQQQYESKEERLLAEYRNERHKFFAERERYREEKEKFRNRRENGEGRRFRSRDDDQRHGWGRDGGRRDGRDRRFDREDRPFKKRRFDDDAE